MFFVCQAVVGPGLPASNAYLPMLLVSLVVWQVHYWKRHQVGRQRFRPAWTVFRLMLFVCLVFGVALFSVQHDRLKVLYGLGGGLPLGCLLAVFAGLRLTRFETTPEGRFYTPNAYIGAALSISLIGRLIYRSIMLHAASPEFLLTYPGRYQSPLTAFLFGITAGYYCTFYIGMLWKGRRPGADS